MYLLGWAVAIAAVLALSYGWLGGLASGQSSTTPV